MYDSGIKASELILAVKSEVDVSIPIPDETYLRSINTVEQFLYTEILKEYISFRIDYSDVTKDEIALEDITVPDGADSPLWDDIIKVFADEWELERAGVIGIEQFPEKQLYYTDYKGKIKLSLTDYPEKITVIVRLRPTLKTKTNDENVMLPAEFVDLVCARMRGEVYRIANEDNPAAKWLNEYNNQLETFKVWATKRNERYGG